MVVHKHLFSLFSFLSLAVVLASFQSTPVTALSLEHSHHYTRNTHQHNLLAKKRSTKQKRCKSRPTPSSAPASASSPASSASSNKVAAAGTSAAPAKQSSAAPAPPPPSSSPKPQSSAPAPAASQSTSSGSVAQRLKEIFPRKYLGAYGGSPSQLGDWTGLDAYYNWGVTSSGSGGPKFIPTLWGTKNQASWQANVVNAQTPPQIVKTYNECEISSQCNLSPQDAASFWNANVLSVVEKGTLVGCPAVTSDPGAPAWLESFFSSCNNGHANCGCSFIDVHYYGTVSADFITWIQGMQKQFPMPMIVSEFACESFTNGQQCDPAQITAFATTMTQFFQSTEYIAAYSPFGLMLDLGNVNPENGLMNSDGSPNALAELYYPGI